MARLVPVAFALVAVAAFAAGLSGIWDPDFFHHLAVGRAVLRGTSFATDPFLYPIAGRPSALPPYWLGSLALWAASLPGGPAGAVVLSALAAAATLSVALADALDGRREPWRLAVAVGAVALVLPELRIRSAPRPEAFGALFLALTLLALRRAERGRPRLLWAFPALAAVWAHVHLSVALGVGLVALHLAGEAVQAALAWRRDPASRPFRALRAPALVLAAGAAATAIPPSSASVLALAWRFLASTLGLGAARTDAGTGEVVDLMRRWVEELRAPGLEDWLTRPFGLVVAVALLSFALHRSRGWLRELASVAALAALTATAFRFAVLAGLVAAPIAARNLGGFLDGVAARRARLAAGVAAALALLGVGVVAASPLLRAHHTGVALVPGALPVRAAEYLRAAGIDARLYNDFGSGGYLEWALDRPVFQDGRGFADAADLRELLPEPVDPARMARLDARWGFEALVIGTEPPAGVDPLLLEKLTQGRDALADRRVWSLVAFDDRAALYLKRSGRWAALAERDEYRVVAPAAPLAQQRLGDPAYAAALTEELRRAARESPSCVRCRLDLVKIALQTGRTADAAVPLAELRALDLPAQRPVVAHLAALEAEQRGDLAAAEGHWREAIRAGRDPAPARRGLARLLEREGRLADAAAEVDRNLAAARTPADRDVEDVELAAALARARGDARAPGFEAELAQARRRAWARSRTEDGIALVRGGRLREALAAFRESIGVDGGDAPTRTHLGFLLIDLRDEGAAAVELGRATQLDPALAEAWFGLGAALDRRADRAGAATAFRRYLALAPRGDWADQARRRLGELEGGR
jgi:Flp pilus assembly protein TadD